MNSHNKMQLPSIPINHSIREYFRNFKYISKFIEGLRRRYMPYRYNNYAIQYYRNKLAQYELKSDYVSNYPWTFGIISCLTHGSINYIKACSMKKVAYKVIDIFSANWIKEFEKSECDLYLIAPEDFLVIWSRLIDDRLRFLVSNMGKTVFPSVESLWIGSSKQRMTNWLSINHCPQPETRVFYYEEEAIDYILTTNFPQVIKLDYSTGSGGVWIVNDKKKAFNLVKKAFRGGITSKNMAVTNRQWRHILFQEHIANAKEWRLIRIGDYYFGYGKLKIGDFHSGSGGSIWSAPPIYVFNLFREIADLGHFENISMDILETQDGQLYIIEVHSVFGAFDTAQFYFNGKPGRYLYDKDNDKWIFEEGRYCENSCYNLRVEVCLQNMVNQGEAK